MLFPGLLRPLKNHPIAQGALRVIVRKKCKNVVNTYNLVIILDLKEIYED